jgi:hypothetical protein
MAFGFNPFTGNFDFTGSGGGGGGSSYIDGEVQNFSALPQTIGSPAVDSAYLVREAEGTWLLARKPAGIYIRTANTGVRADDWTYAGEFPDVFNDANLVVYANADSTKNVKFDVSAVTAGTTRTITVPDANVTLPTPSLLKFTGTGSNIIEFETQELSLNHTGSNDTPYISVSDGVDEALLGLRQGEMFLQGSNPDVRIEQGGGNLANILMVEAKLEDAQGGNGHFATITADGELTDNRTLTVPDASGTIALLETLPAGGTKTYAVFRAYNDSMPPSTNFATLDTRNNIGVADYDDATDESLFFMGIIPEAASLGSGLKIRLHWMATTATSGNVVWDVSLERMTTDLDSDSFDTIASGTAAANGTSGILTVTEITLTTIDSVTAGDGFRLKVTRDANNASDTMTGDAELVAVEVRSAA